MRQRRPRRVLTMPMAWAKALSLTPLSASTRRSSQDLRLVSQPMNRKRRPEPKSLGPAPLTKNTSHKGRLVEAKRRPPKRPDSTHRNLKARRRRDTRAELLSTSTSGPQPALPASLAKAPETSQSTVPATRKAGTSETDHHHSSDRTGDSFLPWAGPRTSSLKECKSLPSTRHSQQQCVFTASLSARIELIKDEPSNNIC